jgi:hypothetical protein
MIRPTVPVNLEAQPAGDIIAFGREAPFDVQDEACALESAL